MARRQKKKQEISLFPFLDILACVIGNLILIITAVVLESVDTDKIATQFANEATKQKTEDILKIYAELEKMLEKLKQEKSSSDARIQLARQQILKAEQDQRDARERLKDLPEVVISDAEEKAALSKQKEDLQEITAEIKKLESKIANKKKQPPKTISILYENRGRGGVRRPFFVEVRKNEIVLIPNELDYKNLFETNKAIKIPTAKIGSDKKFQKLLEYVLTHAGTTGPLRRRRDTIVTFLIRPEGVNSYQAVKKVVDQYEKNNEKRLVVGVLPNGAPLLDALSGKAPLPAKGEILLD